MKVWGFLLKSLVFGCLFAGIIFCFSEAVHWVVQKSPIFGPILLVIGGTMMAIAFSPDEDEKKDSDSEAAYQTYLEKKRAFDAIANEEVRRFMVKNFPHEVPARKTQGLCKCECPDSCEHTWGPESAVAGINVDGKLVNETTQVCSKCGLFRYDHDNFLVHGGK